MIARLTALFRYWFKRRAAHPSPVLTGWSIWFRFKPGADVAQREMVFYCHRTGKARSITLTDGYHALARSPN